MPSLPEDPGCLSQLYLSRQMKPAQDKGTYQREATSWPLEAVMAALKEYRGL